MRFGSFSSEVKHYLSVYKKFISTSTAVAMSFRTSFVLMVMMDLMFFGSAYFTVDFIFDHVDMVMGWNRNQFMLFLSYVLLVDGFHMIILSQNFWRFSDDLKSGQLDYTILRPLSSIFSVFFRNIRPSSIPTLIPAIAVFSYYANLNGFNLLQWALIPLLLTLSLALLAVVEFVISCAMFWLVEGVGINFFRMQMQQLSRWPDLIYGAATKRVFSTLVPILLVGSAPIHFLLDMSKWHYLLIMVVATCVFWFILLKLWERGLQVYDSASS
ncbi:ABC transporter permease [Halobacteriovorax sp. GFR7]|uniref:ABC transporter permease n=1 Tax=unclassified Halobacteriovorax TaxID=2639665 RepID=UPI003D972838